MALALFLSTDADQTIITELKDQWEKTPITVNEAVDETTFAVLVAVHPSWQDDGWLTDDDDSITQYIAEALQQGKRIVPLSLDDAEFTTEAIAPSVQKLVGRAGVAVHPSDVFQLSEQVEELVERLTKLMPKNTASAPPASPAPPPATSPPSAPTAPSSTDTTTATNDDFDDFDAIIARDTAEEDFDEDFDDFDRLTKPDESVSPATPKAQATSAKPKGIYEPIRLPKPEYFNLWWQSALIAIIPFAIYGFTFNVEYSRFGDGWIYTNLDETIVMLAIVTAICGFGVARLWRKRLPGNQYSPFVVGATWAISHYLVVGNLVEGNPIFILLAFVIMGVGHLAAYWNPEHLRWWKLDFKSIRMSVYMPMYWVILFFVSILVVLPVSDAYDASVLPEGEYWYQTASDAQTAAFITYTLTGVIMVSLMSVMFLAVLRRIASKNHPDTVEVIDETVSVSN